MICFNRRPRFIRACTPAFSALLLLASCSRDTSKNSDATFIIDTPVRAVQAQQVSENADWSVPTKTLMTFQACIKDVAKLQKVVSQPFAVQTDSGSVDVQTNDDGCFTWNEEVPFDYSQPETYIQTARSIQGTGAFRGTRQFDLAIDPWQKDALDMRLKPNMDRVVFAASLREGLVSARAEQSGESRPKLTVSEIQFSGNESRFSTDNSGQIMSRLSFSPYLTRKGINGQPVKDALIKGRFEITLTLLAHVPGDEKLLILSEQTVEATSTDGPVRVDVALPLNGIVPPQNATRELAIAIRPVGAPMNILPEEGYIEVASLRGTASPSLMHREGGIDHFLAQAKGDTVSYRVALSTRSIVKTTASCDTGSGDYGFYISNISVSNQGTTSRTATENVPNEITASYEVCLSDRESNKPIADQSFEVQLTDTSGRASAPQQIKTENGCLRFTDPVSFDYFNAEGWVEKTLKITSHEAPYAEISREFPISIDPWASDRGFFWDCRRGAKPSFKTEPASLEMVDFSYNFMGRETEVDSQLNLTLKRHYIVQITPRLKRSTGYDGMIKYEPLVDGKYHLRVILLAPNQDKNLAQLSQMDTQTVVKNFKYISSYENDITTRDGRIIEDIVLPISFADTPILISRAAAIVQLSPLSEDSRLVSRPFFSPFLPMEDFGFLTLLPNKAIEGTIKSSSQQMGESKVDLTQLIALGKKSRERQNANGSSVEDFAKHFGYSRPDSEKLAALGIDSDTIHSLFDRSKITSNTAKKLCALFDDDRAPSRKGKSSAKPAVSCASQPLAALQLAYSRHVEAVAGEAQVGDFSYTTLNVSANLSVTDTNTVGESVGQSDAHGSDLHGSIEAKISASADVRGGLQIPSFLPIKGEASWGTSVGVGASGGKGWFKGQQWFDTHQTTTANSKAGTSGLAFSRTFAVERVTFNVKAATRQCVIVRSKQSSSPGAMLCDDQAKGVHHLAESYYLVTEQNAHSSSPLHDGKTSAEAPWTKAIRGEKAFNALQSVLTDKSRVLVLSPSSIQTKAIGQIDEAIDQFAKTHPRFSDGSFPSVIY